jgi:hypothetical protein
MIWVWLTIIGLAILTGLLFWGNESHKWRRK